MKVLSIIWGLCGGGIDKVALAYTKLDEFPDVEFETVCVHGKNWKTDQALLREYDIPSIVFNNRLDFSWIAKTAKLIKKRNLISFLFTALMAQ